MDQTIVDDTPPRRPSTSHDRPSRTPYGPRIRTRTKHSADLSSLVTSTPDAASPLMSAIGSPTFSNPFSMLESPGSELASPSIHDPPASDPATPHPPIPPLASHIQSKADVAVQVPSTPPSSPIPPIAPSSPAPTLSKSSIGTFVALPPLPPPPSISFEPTPIPWKGLPFEAAQWTFSSEELQQIVSTAIRLSAQESFVRLLSLQALEIDTVEERKRLTSERLAAQAKWRFEVGRRTMLMQALNSTAAMFGSTGEAEGGNPVGGLVSQLASSIASCDSVLASIMRYADQESQIDIVRQKHWSSALGIGLRKLNKAYERQGEELKRVQAQVRTLEDELDEAWREAEQMAVEFDDLELQVETSEGDVVSDGADEGGGDDDDPAKQDFDDRLTINTDIGEVMGVTGTAVISKATLISPKTDKSDVKSVRSARSTRSKRSTRDGPSHVSRLSAARARSRAASNASLRLPKPHRKTASQTSNDVPPVPAIPDRADRSHGQSFLDMGSIGTEFVRQIKKSLPARRSDPKESLPEPPHTASPLQTQVPSIWVETDTGDTAQLPVNGVDRIHSIHIFPSLTSPQKRRRSNLLKSLSCESDEAGGSRTSPVSTHSKEKIPSPSGRPGSAGARLTHNESPSSSPKRSLVSRASSIMLRRLSQATHATKHYTSSLSASETKEENAPDTPPRVGTPNTVEGSVAHSCPD